MICVFEYFFVVIVIGVLYEDFVFFVNCLVINYGVCNGVVFYVGEWCLLVNYFRDYVWNEVVIFLEFLVFFGVLVES